MGVANYPLPAPDFYANLVWSIYLKCKLVVTDVIKMQIRLIDLIIMQIRFDWSNQIANYFFL